MKHALAATVATLVLACPLIPVASAQTAPHVMMAPDALKWSDVPSLPGAKIAVIEGPLNEAVPFTFRLKLPANYQIPAHWHPAIEHVTVLSGTLNMGMGDKFEKSKTTPLKAGSVAIMQPKTNHFVWTNGETVVQLHGVGPWSVNYVNPADDPAKKGDAAKKSDAMKTSETAKRNRHASLSVAGTPAREKPAESPPSDAATIVSMDKRYRPDLTDAARPATIDVAAIDEHGTTREIAIAGEHPLTVYVDKQELLTLMTLGGAPEALTIGYLRNQRLVDSLQEIVSVHVDWEVNAVSVKTRNGLVDLEEKTAKRTKTTGCGQGTVFGDLMEDVDNIKLHGDTTLSRSTLYDLLDRVRTYDTIYKQAGAIHGCALATNTPGRSDILMFVEDVGRHNAVDAIAGQMWLDGLEGDDKIFYTTGRLTSEMVIKAAQMRIPFLVSRSGLTQMGHEIAQKVGMTMIGRATNKHYLLFTGAERFRAAA